MEEQGSLHCLPLSETGCRLIHGVIKKKKTPEDKKFNFL
jgi:hypothetical protein